MKHVWILIFASLALSACTGGFEALIKGNDDSSPAESAAAEAAPETLDTNSESSSEQDTKVQDVPQSQSPEDQEAEAKKLEEALKPENPSYDPHSAESFLLTKSYFSDQLTILPSRPDNYGWIALKGEAAKALYQSLAVAPVTEEGNAIWLPPQVKYGHHVGCYQQARAAQPDALIYACNIYLDYRQGTVSAQKSYVTVDEAQGSLAKNFNNKDLSLIQSAQGNRDAWIMLSGLDAKVLYSLLIQEAEQNESQEDGSLIKAGKDIMCSQKPRFDGSNKVDYACTLILDGKSGAALNSGK